MFIRFTGTQTEHETVFLTVVRVNPAGSMNLHEAGIAMGTHSQRACLEPELYAIIRIFCHTVENRIGSTDDRVTVTVHPDGPPST